MHTCIVLLVAAVLAFLPFGFREDARAQSNFPTHHDTIPNFAQSPTIRSARNGSWSATTTWTPARVPTASDIVLITHAVTYDSTTGNADTIGIGANGILRFSTTQDTSLRVANLLVQPGGILEVGTQSNPIPAQLTAEVVIKNKTINLSNDPDQFGTALISLGTVRMHGAVKSPTFVRLAQAPQAGNTSFTLSQPVSGWQAGDMLVLPDSRQRPNSQTDRNAAQFLEVRTIQSLSADQRTITFSPGLQYTHPGTTDENSDGQPDYLPHIANVTRNILIRSESRTGTRGHVLFTGRANIDIRYTAFEGLGRTTFNDLNTTTNKIGRYSLHLHHVMGPYPTVDPQYQFRLVGNSIYEDAPDTPPQKWGITLHNSHYGLIQDNVVYNVGGAAIVTEDGSESYNIVDHNFAVRVTSNGGRDEHFDQTRGIGREGVGFWFRGPNNYVRNNVAANMGESAGDVEAAYGFKYNMVFLDNVRIPSYRGADTSMSGQYTTHAGNKMPLLEFSNNEMYGLVQGFTIWWLCSRDFDAQAGCGQSVIRNMVVWHAMRYSYYGYPASNYVFDNIKVYGSAAAFDDFGNAVWWYNDYGTKDHIVRNSSFYNSAGVYTPYFRDGIIRFENNDLKTQSGIIHRTSAAPGSCIGCNLPDPDTVLVNNRYAAPAGRPLRSISMENYTSGQDAANSDDVFVCNHNGVAGDNFQVFFPHKSSPCTFTRADISEGYVCVTADADRVCSPAPPPPATQLAAPTKLRVTNEP